MRHKFYGAADPLKWLIAAKSDFAIACMPLPDGAMYEQLCFHAQQAAEKSIKAVLIYSAVDIPYTHNLQMLLDLMPADILDTTGS